MARTRCTARWRSRKSSVTSQPRPQSTPAPASIPRRRTRPTHESLARLAALADNERVIAIGEIGLDYYHLDNPTIPVQHAAFVAQMQVAAAARKPILIHCRTSELATPASQSRSSAAADAWEDLLELIDAHWNPQCGAESRPVSCTASPAH